MQQIRAFTIGLCLVGGAIGFAAKDTRLSYFGYRGADGYDGKVGRPGRDGTPVIITADGTNQTYSLVGEDGEDGWDAEYGRDATNCYQPINVSDDLQGERGGRGGDGGQGGRGGDGGSFTVYYADQDALRSVLVHSSPGRGGRGGVGRRGGHGCYCTLSSWVVNQGGTPMTYRCYSGAHGGDGHDGYYGNNGSYGEAKLIGQMSPLSPTQSQISVPLANMEQGPFVLSANNWANRTGARLLFAPGSVIDDRYTIFTGRTEVNYFFTWAVNRPLSDFSAHSMGLRLEGGAAKLSLPNGLWIQGAESSEPNGRRFTFQNVVHSNEPFFLTLTSITGSGTALTAVVNDAKALSEILKTDYSIDYYVKAKAFYYRRYSGKIPQTAVSYTAGEHKITIGALPIASQYLKAGNQVEIHLYARRSLGGYYGTKEMATYATLKP